MSSNDVPLYTLFQTESGGRYVFDGPTGAVFPTSELLTEAIGLYRTTSVEEVREQLIGRYAEDEVDGVLDFVVRWREHFGGFYRSPEMAQAIEDQANSLSESDTREILLRTDMPIQILLNLTEDCNFRCEYCYLSKPYQYTRNRSSTRMSREVGVNALQYVFDRLKPISRRIPGKVFGVTFYGGEPLLELPLMIELMDYTRKHCPLQSFFNMTTNGSLLTDEVADLLVEYGVHMVVSLDGHRENHDRNRKLPNGDGTFDLVFGNVKRFRERYPEYWKLRCTCVFDANTDLEGNVDFFEENDLDVILVTQASDHNTTYWDRFTDEDHDRFKQQYQRLFARYYELMKTGGKVPRYLKRLFIPIATAVLYRWRHGSGGVPMVPYTANCVPGMKVSVRADGTLDICERVNEKFPIGRIPGGFDYGAITNAVKLYNAAIVDESCARCVFNKSCSLCFSQTCGNGSFGRPPNWCDAFRNTFGGYLASAFSILEAQPLAFEEFKLPLNFTAGLEAAVHEMLFRM
jgi:uncharacterized protein